MPKKDDDNSRPYLKYRSDRDRSAEAVNARRVAFDKANDERAATFDELSEEYPVSKLGASFVPGVGQALAAADVASELNKGNYGRAALNAVGFVPGGKLVSSGIGRGIATQRAMGKTIAPEIAEQAALRGEKLGDRAIESTDIGNRFYGAAEPFMHSSGRPAPMQVALAEDAGAGYKRGGKVKKAAPRSAAKPVKKATSASRRGDGIAQRGKTRGRMV
jgi:hypothetical protein